ncbi:tyrosine--tRNA ligase [Candidatus Roizmanbacteria bacterium]|nr:tyrosine--tRNA ligase [Candidatus Roizmanbacteria bacterium]
MELQERFELMQAVGEEIVEPDQLLALLEKNEKIIAYDGFEPSGQIHIAQGILRAINVNKITKAGVKFKMLVADWHAWANNKMGGDLEKIKIVGQYFIEVWKAGGMDLANVEFVWASDLMKNSNYWKLVLQISKTNALKRFVRTAEIMGREESLDKLTGANIIYSCMQTADIFMLGAKITQLGMDQRKVNMLAREIGPQLGFWKPVVVSHHMLMGLGQPAPTVNSDKVKRTIDLKMSKSKPDTSIFMTDTAEDIKRKVGKAWCPEGQTSENPVLEYCKYIIFEKFDQIIVERAEKFGGTVILNSYANLEKAFAEKQIHPLDLKHAVAGYLDQLLQPVRRHFDDNAYAHGLLEKVKSFTVTR